MSKYLLLLIACTLFIGCGKSGANARFRLEGHVTIDGEPIEKALITFIPIAPTKGKKVTGTVEHGEYVIDKDNGACCGTYLVKIETASHGIEQFAAAAAEGRPPTDPPPTDRKPRPMVAPEFNVNSTLEVTVSEDSEKNHFDFETTSAPHPFPSGH